ncbi:hypothetical protein K1719_019923 [Acacia pycnantha]|nr:hypothetical protein K1719_019923 [Acacia pycnantha]
MSTPLFADLLTASTSQRHNLQWILWPPHTVNTVSNDVGWEACTQHFDNERVHPGEAPSGGRPKEQVPKNEVLKTQDSQEIIAIDDKIRQWSNGKQGNIRSLLSTLQYVLWPNSGWKPVPLVDIIEGNSVKRALLCLHLDKLQQKGAASHQKYIAEKVFDILQVNCSPPVLMILLQRYGV